MAAPSAAFVALGRNIRALREKKKLTQEALGEKAEIHTTYISDIERGVRNPTVAIIFRIAKALGVEPSDLFGGVRA